MNVKKIAVIISAGICSAVALTIGAFAFFSGSFDLEKQEGVVGTLSINPINMQIYDNSGESVESIKTWNPGDINTFTWRVENKGTKSAATRNTVYIYWDEELNNYSDKNDIVYLYDQNISNDDIEHDMLENNAASAIEIGDLKEFSINGEKKTGWKYTISGDILDGVGANAETGDAFEVDYKNTVNDNSLIYDDLAYKIAFSNYANVHTMDKPLKICIATEVMQSRNTSDGVWQLVSLRDVTVSDGEGE